MCVFPHRKLTKEHLRKALTVLRDLEEVLLTPEAVPTEPSGMCVYSCLVCLCVRVCFMCMCMRVIQVFFAVACCAFF